MFEAVVVALYSAVMVWLFICAVVRTIDEEGERAMKVKKQKQLRKQAQELANMWGTEVEEWMLWDGWESWVGCEWCSENGPAADCWGFAKGAMDTKKVADAVIALSKKNMKGMDPTAKAGGLWSKHVYDQRRREGCRKRTLNKKSVLWKK